MQSGTTKNQFRRFSVLRWWFAENRYAKREEQKRQRKKTMKKRDYG